MRDTDTGILLFEDKMFYYLEYGNIATPMNIVDRITKVLVGRSKKLWDTENPGNPNRLFRLVTVKEAREQELQFSPIYVSAMAKLVATERANKKVEAPKKWGRKE